MKGLIRWQLPLLLAASGTFAATRFGHPYLMKIGLLYLIIAGLVAALIRWPLLSPAKSLTPSLNTAPPPAPLWARTQWVLAGIIITTYVLAVYHYTVNVPFQDDYGSSLRLLRDPSSLFKTIGSFFTARAMEHIVAGTNLLLLMAYRFAGGFSAGVLTTQGLLIQGLFAYLLWQAVSKEVRPFAVGLIAALVFQVQFWMVSIWPTNLGGVFLFQVLVLGAFLALHRHTPAASALSAFCAFLATHTFGPGFLVFFLGLAYLLAKERRAVRSLGASEYVLNPYYSADTVLALVPRSELPPLRLIA